MFRIDQPKLIASNMIAGGTVTIGAVTTPPTKGTTTTDKVVWTRFGQFLYAYYEYVQTGAGSAGSGNYLISLPAGLSVDTTIITVNTTINTVTGNSTTLGTFNGFAAGASQWDGVAAVPYSATQFRISGLFGATANVFGSANCALSNTTVTFGGYIICPISGWTMYGP